MKRWGIYLLAILLALSSVGLWAYVLAHSVFVRIG